MRRVLILGFAAICLAPSLCAYDVALENGSVIHFQKYRVADNKLIYLSESGEELSVPMSDINLSLTRQMNEKEKPPLELPGLTGNAKTKQSPEPLGDVARQLGVKPESDAEGHVFTNDDFPSSPVPPEPAKATTSRSPAANGAKSNADWASSKAKIELFLRKTGNLTERQYADRTLGPDLADVEFPRRSSWQAELYAAHQEYVADAKLCISDRVSDMGRHQNAACYKLDSDKSRVQTLREKGQGLAQEWKTRQERAVSY